MFGDLLEFLFYDYVKCQHPNCGDFSQMHLAAVEYNQRYGMPSHYNPQQEIERVKNALV